MSWNPLIDTIIGGLNLNVPLKFPIKGEEENMAEKVESLLREHN